mmetsp:Transcript_32931/g.80042  ORF Transcript_32931/g.80042 Transcript_32931/m.80042 type:complete len:227 (+) Transcript_32931:224-904(+)
MWKGSRSGEAPSSWSRSVSRLCSSKPSVAAPMATVRRDGRLKDSLPFVSPTAWCAEAHAFASSSIACSRLPSAPRVPRECSVRRCVSVSSRISATIASCAESTASCCAESASASSTSRSIRWRTATGSRPTLVLTSHRSAASRSAAAEGARAPSAAPSRRRRSRSPLTREKALTRLSHSVETLSIAACTLAPTQPAMVATMFSTPALARSRTPCTNSGALLAMQPK